MKQLQTIKTTFFKPTKLQEFKEAKIITFDIETKLINNEQIPYLYSMYDGKNAYSWFTSTPDLLFKELFKQKYKGYQVYAHNLTNFDLIFILKYLGMLHKDYSIGLLKRDTKIMQISIYNKKKSVSLTIKDSYLLLPASLAKNFNTTIQKGLEPVLISGINIDPESLQYVNSSANHYNKEIEIIHNNSNEDFLSWKNKIQSYCEDDCISLYQVLIKFRDLIYSNFGVLIDFNPTTPSVAFSIYKSGYLLKETIQCIDGTIDRFIRKSYTGGSTDMIIPLPEKDELVYVYDGCSISNRFFISFTNG